LTLGWRWRHYKWPVTKDKPWIFIELPDKDLEFDDDFPTGDSLSGEDVTLEKIAESVFKDINNMETAFIEVEVVPDDTDNPPADSNYTDSHAKGRTFTLTLEKPGNGTSTGRSNVKASGGKIKTCDIQIENGKSGKDFMAVFAHEVGHCLGLDHPQDITHAVMSYFRTSNVYRYTIDDKIGISTLYPDDDFDLDEKSTFGLSCTPN
ncbi:MAG: matrixin family metalloprotease, partial [Bdellovibrionales bacterium]|nr:matrixin family metalloprotease [Bdellovibrionales bacterium]